MTNRTWFSKPSRQVQAIARKIKEVHQLGQPILVGTVSIDKNEYLSALLNKEGVSYTMLNAKHHEKEGEIVAQAGRKGGVTIATNMAGRGVDIVLGGNPPIAGEGEEVKKSGRFVRARHGKARSQKNRQSVKRPFGPAGRSGRNAILYFFGRRGDASFRLG